jgi:hypothetical protein
MKFNVFYLEKTYIWKYHIFNDKKFNKCNNIHAVSGIREGQFHLLPHNLHQNSFVIETFSCT